MDRGKSPLPTSDNLSSLVAAVLGETTLSVDGGTDFHRHVCAADRSITVVAQSWNGDRSLSSVCVDAVSKR